MNHIVALLLTTVSINAMAEWKDNLYNRVVVYQEKSKDAPQDLKAIKDMLAKGTDPNMKEDQTPVIFKALDPDKLNVLKLLIEYNADVNGRDKDGDTPLMRASFSTAAFHPKDLSVVQFLLDHKADPNLANRNNMTALHLAAANLKLDAGTGLVDALLNAGADPNVVMSPGGNKIIGFTPMATAARKGNNAVIQVLARAKADPNLKGTQGVSALKTAKESGHPESAKLIESLGGRE